jgi:branched-chain amino acid transport system ATP-binding protein
MLKLNNVTLKFGGLTANKNVSFEVKKGEIFGLIGPNGAGKTTLFNVISGVYKPTEGSVEFLGKDISGKKPYQVNMLGIARTYQNINLFGDMTVLENVMVGRHSRTKAGIFSAMFRLGKHRREEKDIVEKSMEVLEFMGLKDLYNYKASSLSYGQQRRLEIARAMASEPELLLLDEPAAGMNTGEKLELREDIKKIQKYGITILIVEHDMRVVFGISERVAVLNYGELIALGTPNEVQKNEDVINAYLGGDI